MYKLNIEEAIFKNQQEDGMGAIIRDAQGLVIAVMTGELESEVCARIR